MSSYRHSSQSVSEKTQNVKSFWIFLQLEMMEVAVATCKFPVKSPPSHHHTLTFYWSFLSPNQGRRSLGLGVLTSPETM